MCPRRVIFAEEVAFSIASPSKFDSRPFEELCRPHSFLGEEYTRSNFQATQVWPAVFVGEGWGRLEGVRFLNYVSEARFWGQEATLCVFHMRFYTKPQNLPGGQLIF